MDVLLNLFLLVILPWWGVTGWFFALAHGAQLRDEGVEFGWIIKGGIYPFLATGVLFDVLFNLTWGSVIFRELPREFLFTQRVKRHLREKYHSSRRGRIAREWQIRLNKVMPDHI